MDKKNKKIMIIDDDKEFLGEMAETLKLSGYSPITVFDSSIATKQASKSKPDLILLDLKMGNKSGFKVAGELMSKAETHNIPVIAITGVFTKHEHRLLMRICNIKECLLKPIKPLDIIHKIENICKK